MTDEELGRKIMVEAGLRLANFRDSDIDRIGAAARTILAAERQEVTREAVRQEVTRLTHDWSRDTSRSMEARVDLAMCVLHHFAPAREVRPIDGMSVEDWEAAFFEHGIKYYAPEDRVRLFARAFSGVAHRLAQPVKVDPDAEARELFDELKSAGWNWAGYELFDWLEAPKPAMDFCRNFVAKRATAAKEAGRE